MGRGNTVYSIVQYDIHGEKESMWLIHWLLCVDSDITCDEMKTCHEFKHPHARCISNIFLPSTLQQ